MMMGSARTGSRSRDRQGQGTLAGMRAGERAEIVDIPDATARAQALRFGMGAGARVRCVSTIPGGPVVLRAGRQEIAIGRGLARRIAIRPQEVSL